MGFWETIQYTIIAVFSALVSGVLMFMLIRSCCKKHWTA
jgi:hypothetical protein